ncbi:cold-shock protein [Microlunatus endophyticus]|uniref:cold-shock protein n=1 Tax=Microlunatus endophyticus TaxID=1716077 RepID=UPI001E47ACD2|nr:cold shock domain-containing protein [Microlunatus endophyticus]
MRFVVGSVISWNAEEGWGVLVSDEVESEIFAHFSELVVDGYRSLQPGQVVRFECEHFPSGQDGYGYRANNIRLVD